MYYKTTLYFACLNINLSSQNPEDAEQIKLYKEKRKLDKQLQEQKSLNAELEANLQGLVRSQRSKSKQIYFNVPI